MVIKRIGKYRFELLSCSQSGTFSDGFPYYVSIRDITGTPICDTQLTHRFESIEQARQFCCKVSAGNLSIDKLIEEGQAAFSEWNAARMRAAESDFHTFIDQVKSLGITAAQLEGVFSAYNQLPAEAREMVYDNTLVCRSFLEDAPLLSDPHSFGFWLDSAQKDVDVCLMDGDSCEHYLSGVCYLSPEVRKELDVQYTDLEEWLFTLPVDHVVHGTGGAPLAVLRTEYTRVQTDFLLGDSVDAFLDRDMAEQCERAAWANASFTGRLSYLRDGSSFEIVFDPTCMDAKSESDRKSLCSFVAAHTHVYIASVFLDDLYIVYSICKTDDGRIYRVECPICIKLTDAGQGLSSTLEGKVLLARQKSEQSRRG